LLAPPPPTDPDIDLRRSRMSPGRRFRDRLATVLMGAAFLAALIPLVFILVTVVGKGISVIRTEWFTHDIPDVASFVSSDKADAFGIDASAFGTAKPVYGMQPAIVGTLLTTGLAALLAIPLGILGAIYLNEYGKRNRLARTLRFFSDVMTGVPSIIMGIFLYTIFVVPQGLDGRSAIAGGLALACLMLPIVVRSTEEMLKLVPNSLREASAALGTRTWRTTVGVVLPAALGGVTSGCMLAVARAAGETAPILLTVGSTRFTNWSLHGNNTSLSREIYANATQPGGESLAWGAALTLIAVVLAMTLLARFVTSKLSIRAQ
ncbi:MAG: phosphate ABC transporter permease PstA, partial [Acidimicrobiales bacterium]